MADDVELNAGSGGDTIAADEIGGKKHQRVKVQHGADGSATDVSAASPLPVSSASLPLPTGAATAAKQLADGHAVILSANDGVDIGDVDVTSVVPGTGATNLGKAIDSAVGATDTGVALLAKHKEDQVHLGTADDDYDVLTIDSLGSLHVNAEAHHIFDELDVTTGWTVLGNDTLNLATTAKHVMGVAALTFDKVNGAANTIFAGIQKTLSSVDLGQVSPHDILQGSFYLPDLTDVAYCFLRLGTDSSNYNEWRLPVDVLTAAVWETGALSIGDADYDGITGNGMTSAAITYIAVGVAFNDESDTLAGIVFDQVSYHTNQHTSTSINAEVSSSVSSANINVQKVGGSPTTKGAGNAGNGSQRVVLATDDINTAAIKVATEALQSGQLADGHAVTVDNASIAVTAASLPLPSGAATSAAQLADGHNVTVDNAAGASAVNIQDGGNSITVDGTVTADAGTNLNTSALLTTAAHDAALGVAGTADAQVRSVQGIASMTPLLVDATGQGDVPITLGGEAVVLGAGSAAIGKLAANTGVDIGDVDILSIAAGDNNIGNVDIVTLPASTNTLEVVGDVAHDAAAAGNPVLTAARATASVEGLTEVAAADSTFIAADLSGVQIVRQCVVPQEIVTYSVSNTAGTEIAVTGLDAGGAGIHNYVSSIIIHNAHATTMGFVQLLDGSGGTVLATFPAPATGGTAMSFPVPLKQTTANTALYFDVSAAITTIYITIVGYQGQG